MIKEIYFRDPTDPKYRSNKIETTTELESVIEKIRMILFTKRGEVLGYPNLGMDLDDFVFDFDFNENILRTRFYSQIYQFIPDREFLIDLDIQVTTNGVQKFVNLYIKINDQTVIGVIVK
ncbi:MAG: hypothetical protein BWY04_01552 [candidate division CPR1 bacterium ADurb.Bin160]|uniref:Gene 25-like lysozyme n=1 Tax=candidate division CPR1 bacterium ADurb.Bin160 TaxID=1852826 RepID=A0A1V5ZHL1_9BACT|nr:MAG: hypothetical protein BWY04_01552 [candidate division CPR1 bacterium ADurb.Bin160]